MPLVFLVFFLSLNLQATAQTTASTHFRAEGFGASSTGGRGGRIIEVTNLDDRGPGSLRAAVQASGPRIVVFRLGGTIVLDGPLFIEHPFLTIAGQTAPGDGITLKSTGPVIIGRNLENGEEGAAVHDIILQHLRFRRATAPGIAPLEDNQDALTILGGSHAIVIDHCSFSWGTDETLSVVDRSFDVSIQWCIVSESFAKASLISSGARNVTIHHTLYAHNPERNAKLKGRPESLAGRDALFDFVNNVVYDWRGYATAVAGSGMANIIGNYYIPGAGTPWPIPREIVRMQDLTVDGRSVRSVYAAGNMGPSCPDGCLASHGTEDWDAGMVSDINGKLGDISRARLPRTVPAVTTTRADQALEDVLDWAGASFGLDAHGRTFKRRDAVDRRVVANVRNRTGTILNRRTPIPSDAWPLLAPGQPYADADRDGMADLWEEANGLDPARPQDNLGDPDGDQFTNIEEFLNGTAPRTADPPAAGPRLRHINLTDAEGIVNRPLQLDLAIELADNALETSATKTLAVDLAPLGHAAQTPLANHTANRYTGLISAAAPPQAGRYYLPVLVENIPGIRSILTHLKLSVYPDREWILFSEETPDHWTTERAILTPYTDTAFRGQTSLALTPQTGFHLAWQAPQTLDSFGYHLRFAFHPGRLEPLAQAIFNVTFKGENLHHVVPLLDQEEPGLNLALQTWQTVDIFLEDLEGSIDAVEFNGLLKGTFYLDEIRLVPHTPSATAIATPQQAAQPVNFHLEQNHPNPFNSNTVIPFSLAHPARVELTVYNLAGQAVARLVQERRPAGPHAVVWHGQNAQGQPVASGVYLYRLRQGGLEQTRKLLLIR